jgi:hypothetical protein
VETLHGHNDEALSGIVEPIPGDGSKPFNRTLERNGRIGIIGLDWVIDDEKVAAPASQRPTNRSPVTMSATGGLEFACQGVVR